MTKRQAIKIGERVIFLDEIAQYKDLGSYLLQEVRIVITLRSGEIIKLKEYQSYATQNKPRGGMAHKFLSIMEEYAEVHDILDPEYSAFGEA